MYAFTLIYTVCMPMLCCCVGPLLALCVILMKNPELVPPMLMVGTCGCVWWCGNVCGVADRVVLVCVSDDIYLAV